VAASLCVGKSTKEKGKDPGPADDEQTGQQGICEIKTGGCVVELGSQKQQRRENKTKKKKGEP